VTSPQIAVLGLNPHAGEKGKIGFEEIDVIEPVISNLKNKNSVNGPFVPDAFFATKQFNNYDAVLGMYHDQLLIPFKMLNFNSGVNFTAGLPVIRTSPDHGTAYDIAGKGIADESSMIQAAKWAEKIVRNRKINEIKRII
jgi:4-hydroxythreonine-4-phosphate dehydrogenase